jgi:hypothetical protein
MAQKIKVSNPEINYEARTNLTVDYANSTNLSVRSSRSFSTNYFAIVGEPTQDQTEIKLITNVTDPSVITITSALSYSHPKSTPIYQSEWDKISFERKPTAGSYAVISGSPFNIEWDDADNGTLIYVSDGQSTDTYRWRYYNSTTGIYSDYADVLLGTGLARNQLGYIIEQVRKSPIAISIDDATLIQYANEYQTLVYDEIPKAWWFTKEGTAVATAADTYKYSIEDNWSDFLSMKYLLFNYISGDIDETYPLSPKTNAEFYNMKSDANQPTDDYAKHWTMLPPDGSSDKGYIAIDPTSKTTACRIKPVYFFELTDLDTFGDEVVVPYPKGYQDYILYRIYDDIKNDNNNASKFNDRVLRSIIALKRRSRQMGTTALTRYRGQRGVSRLFGDNSRMSSSDRAEMFW